MFGSACGKEYRWRSSVEEWRKDGMKAGFICSRSAWTRCDCGWRQAAKRLRPSRAAGVEGGSTVVV